MKRESAKKGDFSLVLLSTSSSLLPPLSLSLSHASHPSSSSGSPLPPSHCTNLRRVPSANPSSLLGLPALHSAPNFSFESRGPRSESRRASVSATLSKVLALRWSSVIFLKGGASCERGRERVA